MTGYGNRIQRALVAALQEMCGRVHSVPSRAAGACVSRFGAQARRRAAGFLRGESGNIIIFTALFMGIAFLGVAALAIDAGWIYHEQREVQQAADDGALAAATAESQSGAPTKTAAANAVKGNGFTVVTTTPTAGQATVSVSDGILGPTASSLEYVKVTVAGVTSTFFLGAFNSNLATMSVQATAEASYTVTKSGSGGPCLLTTGTTGQSLTLNGGSKISDGTGSTCGITVDSTANGGCGSPAVMEDSGANVTVASFDVVSAPSAAVCNNGITYGNSSSDPVQGSPVNDPFKAEITAGTLTAPPEGTSQSVSNVSGTTTLSPGYYQYGINFGGSGYTVTLNPGVYYMGGSVNVGGITINGTGGVTIYMASGQLNMNSAATVNLTAPSSGDTAGLVIWQASGNTNEMNLDSGSNSAWNGGVYVPSAELTLNGGSNVASYGMVVANQVMLNSNITLSCTSMPGGSCPGGTSGGTATAVPGGVNMGQ